MEAVVEYFTPLMFPMINLVMPMLAGLTFVIVLSLAFMHKSQQQSRPEHRPLIVAFCFLGVILGVIAGGSSTPIGEALVTGILGVITALLTYLLSKNTTRNWRIFIPYVMVALLISAFMGLIVGANYKAITMPITARNNSDEQLRNKYYEEVMMPMCLHEIEKSFEGIKPSSDYKSACNALKRDLEE